MVDAEKNIQKCPKCSAELLEDDKFCTSCGYQINGQKK